MRITAKGQITIPSEKPKRRSLTKEPFVGMWRSRKDMRDSSDWVRKARKREWDRR